MDATSTEIFRYSFDPNGRLTNRWTAAKGNTVYRYDLLGNLTNVDYAVSPDLTMQYDALNRLTNLVDAVGTNVYTYDAASQLLSEDGPWASDTLTYTYAQRLRTSLTLQQPTGSWTNGYLYDVAKRLTNITSQAGAFGYAYEATRPALVSKLTLPNTAYITNTYDAMTRLLSTKLLTSSSSLLNSHSYAYNLINQRTALTNTAGDYRNYTYDNLGQLKTALGYESDASPRHNERLGYTYDAAGNLNYRTNNAFVQTFNNNSLNELTAITRTGTLTVAGNTTTVATNVTVNGLTADGYTDLTYARTNFPLVDGTTNFTAIAQSPIGLSDTNTVSVDLRATNTLLYDLNGNLRTNGNQILEYDDENQLVTNWVASAWKSEFVYDGQQRLRISRDYQWDTGTSGWVKTNEVRLFYDGVVVIQERDTSNSPLTSYTRSGSYLLARTDNSASSHAYYQTDGNRNVTALINTNQLIVAKYLYDPFGNTLATSGPLAGVNLYQFASQRYHANSGLSLYLRRAYSPTLQRFINRDPIEEEGGINLYGFVDNDPINGFDPLGLYTSLNALAGASAADIAFLFGQGAAGGMAMSMLTEEARQFGKWAGGDCNALNPDKIIDEGAKGALWGAALAVPSAYVVRAVGVAFNAVRASLSAPTATAAMQSANAAVRQVVANRLTQAEFDFVKGDLSGRLTQWSTASLGSRVAAQYQQFYNDAWQQTIQAHAAGRIEISAGQNLMTVFGQRTDAAARTALTRWVKAQGLAKDVLINKRFYDPSGSGAYRIPDVRIPSERLILDGTIGTKTLATPQVRDFMNWSGGRNPVIINPTITPVP